MSDETPNQPEPPSPKQLRREAKAAVKAAEHRRQDRLRDAKRALEAPRKEQAQRIKTAARSVNDAEKAHKRAVAAAEDSVAKAEEGEALAACAPYTLFADRVYTPEGTVWLKPGMQATADASGNLQVEHRPTATRCCLCGCIPAFFLRKRETHDSRRLFISVSGPGVASVGQVRPSMERAARQFVAAFNAAAANGPAARLRREGAIEEARQALQAARTDRSMVEEAERQVEEATSDIQAIHAAEEALAAAEADTAELDAARARLSELEGGPR